MTANADVRNGSKADRRLNGNDGWKADRSISYLPLKLNEEESVVDVTAAMICGPALGFLGAVLLVGRVLKGQTKVAAVTTWILVALSIPLNLILSIAIGGNFGGAFGSMFAEIIGAGERPLVVIGIFAGMGIWVFVTTLAIGFLSAILTRFVTQKR